jgi:hypothetical protein
MSEEKKEVTNVQEVDVDIDEILGFGAESVMTADEQVAEKKPNVFSPINVDTSFLDKPAEQVQKKKLKKFLKKKLKKLLKKNLLI